MEQYAIFLTFKDVNGWYFERIEANECGGRTIWHVNHIDKAKWFRGINATESYIDYLYREFDCIVYAEPVLVRN